MIALQRNRSPRSLALWLLAICVVGSASWVLILWAFMLAGAALRSWL
ncbi:MULTISPECIES: hypothetical protein [unclassified Rhodococcus (in: high G+C Gram-positive bacteria)]|nr:MULTISPECIES: hypothetical protein [unclassified Rhodococcus (in: high G+C Gram-positive bacteria)]